jgi:hypothetical protein
MSWIWLISGAPMLLMPCLRRGLPSLIGITKARAINSAYTREEKGYASAVSWSANQYAKSVGSDLLSSTSGGKK